MGKKSKRKAQRPTEHALILPEADLGIAPPDEILAQVPVETKPRPEQIHEGGVSIDTSAQDAEVTAKDTENSSDGSLKRAQPHDDDGGEWQVVARPNKKLKKVPKPGKNYPTIAFSPNARLQSKINLANLRDLVTYIFADGPGPQWVGITHRPAFRKIVALMIPGLEEAMFKASVDFAKYNNQVPKEDSTPATSSDDYYPRALKKENLPEALQPLPTCLPTCGLSRHQAMIDMARCILPCLHS